MAIAAGELQVLDDLFELARSLNKLPGVTGVWLNEVADDEAAIYVTVAGLDEAALTDRYRVYRKVAEFVEAHRDEIERANFVFNYSVLLDDEEMVVDPAIPPGAKHIDAA